MMLQSNLDEVSGDLVTDLLNTIKHEKQANPHHLPTLLCCGNLVHYIFPEHPYFEDGTFLASLKIGKKKRR